MRCRAESEVRNERILKNRGNGSRVSLLPVPACLALGWQEGKRAAVAVAAERCGGGVPSRCRREGLGRDTLYEQTPRPTARRSGDGGGGGETLTGFPFCAPTSYATELVVAYERMAKTAEGTFGMTKIRLGISASSSSASQPASQPASHSVSPSVSHRAIRSLLQCGSALERQNEASRGEIRKLE